MYLHKKIFNNLYKISNKNFIISFSAGQDSINLFIFLNMFKNIKNASNNSIFWCNHLWKKEDFYLLKHCLKLNFIFKNQFFYAIFFSKQYYENNARKNRYKILFRIIDYSKSEYILTGHNKNDNVETFFLNLFRGSGKLGLNSIKNSQILLKTYYYQNFY